MIKVERSDRTRFVVECHGNRCKWGFYATRVDKSNDWQIITINDKHSCNRSFNPRLVSPKYLAKRYLDDFKSSKGVDTREFIEKVYKELTYNIFTHTVLRTRKIALEMIEGKYSDQYARLWDYVEELRTVDERNILILNWDEALNGIQSFL